MSWGVAFALGKVGATLGAWALLEWWVARRFPRRG